MRGTDGTGRGRRTAAALAPLLATAVLAAGCQTTGSVIPAHDRDPVVTIATADFAEVELVGRIVASALSRAGYRVTLDSRSGPQDRVVDSVAEGRATFTVGFTGELMSRYDPSATARSSADVYAAMTAALPEGLTAGDAAPAEDAPAYVVSKNTSDTAGLRRMSDLRGRCGEFALGARRSVLDDAGLSAAVGTGYDCSFARREVLPDNPREVARALQEGRVGIGVVQSTDPVLSLPDMVALPDDLDVVTAQNLVPVFAKGSLTEDQLTLVNKVFGELTSEDLQELLRGPEYGTGSPADLGNYWLDKHGY